MQRLPSVLVLSALAIFLSAPADGSRFKNPRLIPTTYDPSGVVTGDFNHDGRPDLIYVDGRFPATVHVLFGNGNGTFSHGQDINLPSGICGSSFCVINLADVTADGNDDLVFAGRDLVSGIYGGVIAVLAGNGDGTYQSPVTTLYQHNNAAPAVRIGIGDMNEDGAADIVAVDAFTGDLYLLFGDNKGNFKTGGPMLSATRTAAYLADLNGDGHVDIVATDTLGALFRVFLGNGDGTFQPSVYYGNGAPTGAMFLTDIDGDGHLDVGGQVSPGKVAVLKGKPDGTFAPAILVADAPYGSMNLFVAVADCSDDGLKDLLFLIGAGLGIVFGQGNLTFGPVTPILSGTSSPTTVVTGDFNGDHHTDIAMGVSGGIVILEGSGSETFASGDLYDVGHPVGAVAVADYNGDGHADIAVTVPAMIPLVLRGDGLGSFSLAPDPNPSYGSQSPVSELAAGDFNGDGKKDLVTLEVTPSFPFGQSVILFGAGNGTFSQPVAVLCGISNIADVNNDGRSDLLCGTGTTVTILLGQLDGSFASVTTVTRNGAFGRLPGVGDVNHDGVADILLGGADRWEVWLGKGDGTFQFNGTFDFPSPGTAFGQTAIVDVDGDGNADFVVAPYPYGGYPTTVYALIIYYGNGDGTFGPPVSLPMSHLYSQFTVADVDQDNRPDLIFSDGGAISVILNLGARNFGPETHYVAGQSGSKLRLGDVNSDGFPDIIVANDTTVAVLLNQPAGGPLGTAPAGVFNLTPAPSSYSSPVDLTLTVSASSPGGPVPTGSVSFSGDGSFITTVLLVSGTASYTFSPALLPGIHTFVATFNGDATYVPASFAKLHTIQPPVYATQTVLTATPSSALTSQTIHLTATVSSTPQLSWGMVSFFDGSTTLGLHTVDTNGIAVLDTALLAAGTHNLTATYQGFTYQTSGMTEIFDKSTSTPVNVVMTSTPTVTTLSASNTSPTAGTVVTFTANVSTASSIPFGGVTFFDGSVLLGTTSLRSDGSTRFSTASLGKGSHSITAAYNANATFAGGVSLPVGVTVAEPPPSLGLVAVSLRRQDDPLRGDTTLVAKVNALEGFPEGAITFLDQGEILGTATTDNSGMATFSISSLGDGDHTLSASFAGNESFAPGVSPDLVEQWPATGVGFSLSAVANSISVTPAGSDPVMIRIVPADASPRDVQLSCVAGLPEDYVCTFSPSSVQGGGVSTLFIHRKTGDRGDTSLHSTLLWNGALFAAVLSLFLGGRKGRNRRVALLLGCFSLCTMTACSAVPVSDSAKTSRLSVLTIRANSNEGPMKIVHSLQVLINLK